MTRAMLTPRMAAWTEDNRPCRECQADAQHIRSALARASNEMAYARTILADIHAAEWDRASSALTYEHALNTVDEISAGLRELHEDARLLSDWWEAPE